VTEPNSVTIVAHDIGPNGGMELVLLELIKGLVAAGDRVTVIARTCDAPGLDIVFHRVPGPNRPFVIAYPWFFVAAGLILRRHRDGLVQTTGAIVANRVDITSVHFCHAGFAAKAGIPRTSRSGLLFRVNARLAAAMSRIGERFCYRPSRVAAVVAVSRGIADELRAYYPTIANLVVVIPNGVDVERFAPNATARSSTRLQLGLTNNSLVALFVGGDWERKGLAFAIEALAQAPQWILLIAGNGDQGRYRELASRSGVADRTHFLGQVADTTPAFQAADVLLLPTAYEADPLVVIEAAATGLAVLATPVNGIVDLIQDAVSGYFIARNAASIALYLQRLAFDGPALARMGVEARSTAAARSWRSVVEQHRALYATVLA
jgi:glycosyltransferase involved in cell wall biosynthesis